MCGVGRLLARPRIGAQFNVRRGFFRPAECPRRLALRSCYDYVLGLCGLMKDVVGRVFRPLRCFAALPRKLALLWGWMEVLAVATFYPRALGLVAFLELIFIPYAE